MSLVSFEQVEILMVWKVDTKLLQERDCPAGVPLVLSFLIALKLEQRRLTIDVVQSRDKELWLLPHQLLRELECFVGTGSLLLALFLPQSRSNK